LAVRLLASGSYSRLRIYISQTLTRRLVLTGSSHGKTLSADLERENLASHNPSDGSPGTGEEEDVYADKCDHSALSRSIIGTNDSAGDGDDELAYSHADGTEEKEIAATPCFDEIQAWESRSYVDRRSDHGDDKGA
jgi:hypothetical protein